MPQLRLLSAVEQVAAYFREELKQGRWIGNLPGVDALAAELAVNRKTVVGALRQLEKEGLLANQGAGRKRRVIAAEGDHARPLRIAFLAYEPAAFMEGYVVEMRHLLLEAGHMVFFAEKTLMDLDIQVERVARQVKASKADAWIVSAGSRPVLEWFCTQPLPTFALFGRRDGLPIASVGPDKPPALTAAVRHLIGLGHTRIVLLVRKNRRFPVPGTTEQAFLDELRARGIPASPYNLPEWEETAVGYKACLHELFRVTPPTALLIDEVPLYIAAQQFLARRRLLVPEQVSLVCMDDHINFEWCQPSVAHIHWDTGPVVRRVVRWAANVGQGKKDLRQTLTRAEFVGGGTIGPPPEDQAG